MLKSLQMVFQNEAGKNVTINLSNLKDGTTAAEVKTLMQKIIDKNLILSTGGALKAIVSANIVDKDVTELAVK